MSLVVKICWIFCAFAALVSAQNTPCLKYLSSCAEGSSNCCDYPAISCLPDRRNGTSCLSLFDVVNINPSLTGAAALKPLLRNATGFLAETINVNGKNVYNITEKFPPKPIQTTKPPNPALVTKPIQTTKKQEVTTEKPHEHETKHEPNTNKHESHESSTHKHESSTHKHESSTHKHESTTLKPN